MNLLEEYKNHLNNKKKKSSKNTIKNYICDIRAFIAWLEKKHNTKFEAKKISLEAINVYKSYLTNNHTSAASIERYLSSLRNFFEFLKSRNLITRNPFTDEVQADKLYKDSFLLSDFKIELLSTNLSKVSVKNYLLDIRQFVHWFENITSKQNQISLFEQLKNIDELVVNEYSNRLFKEAHLSASSINRKLSSIRKYLNWIGKKDLKISKISNKLKIKSITDNIENKDIISQNNKAEKYDKIHENSNKINEATYPVLFKLPIKMLSFVYDSVVIIPITSGIDKFNQILWILKGRNIFLKPVSNISKRIKINKINNIPKSIYSPLNISLKDFPVHKRIYHHLKYARPKWYKIYHSFNFTTYFHLGVLIIFTTVCGFTIYSSLENGFLRQNPVFASPSVPPAKTLLITGKLTDETNNAISKATQMRFSIYNDRFATGSALLWEETQAIAPDTQGWFSATLGKETQIPSSIFADNPGLYLGMTVGADKELAPRQQLATISYTANSQMLQGLKPITENNNQTSNVVLALDSTGNLNIGGNASPVFEATGGKFTISGRTLLLTTADFSNNNIEIAPDGSGIIDLQKPIQNTSNNNNITSAQGAVEIDDLLAILATSSGQSAFTINQNSSGPIISASAGGIAKFTIDNDGSGFLAGNLILNGQNLTSSSTSFNLLNSSTSISIGAPFGSTTINNTLIAGGGITVPLNRSLIVGGFIASSLLPFAPSTYNLGSPTSHWNNAYIDNLYISENATSSGFWKRQNGQISTLSGTDSLVISNITAKTYFVDNQGEGDLFTASASGVSRFVITKNGNIGISDTNPSNTLKVVGSLCVSATPGNCAGNTPGTIYSNDTILRNADVAENYISSERLEPGDIIMPEGKDNPAAIIKTAKDYETKLIGIVSSRPGITLNSQAVADALHPYIYPIALSGRVPVKVSSLNGAIQPGDYITSSSIPGIGMKATGRGVTIGKALESYSNSDINSIGKIEVFINLSYVDTSTGYNERYNHEYNSDAETSVLSNLSKGLIDNINTGFLQAQNIITDSLDLTTQNIKIGGETLQSYISSEVEKQVSQIRTGQSLVTSHNSPITILSPLASTSAQGSLSTQPSSSPTISTSLASQSSSFSQLPPPNVAAGEVGSTPDASGSAKPATDSAKLATDSAKLATDWYLASDSSQLIATSSTFLSNLGNGGNLSTITLNASSTTPNFSTLMVFGQSLLSDVSVTGNLNVGGSLILDNNSINTIGNSLEVQSLRQGNLSIMGGLVTIDTNGNLHVSGNATFSKDVTVKGQLTTNIIAPIPNSDLVIKLNKDQSSPNSNSVIHNSKFVIRNSSQSAVLAVNNVGDITASGSGSFSKIAAKGLNIVREAQADTSLTETIASSSAGTAVITEREIERTIISPFVTNNSLIYLTAASDTQGLTPYIARQTDNSFTIAIPYPINKDIKINWWIIN